MYQRHVTGQDGEDQAAQYLQTNGYTILERNWRKRIGEIDLIAQKGQVIYFFEVKTRSSLRYGHPFHAIGRRKRMMIRRLGLTYVTDHRLSYSGLAIGAVGVLSGQIICLPIIDSLHWQIPPFRYTGHRLSKVVFQHTTFFVGNLFLI